MKRYALVVGLVVLALPPLAGVAAPKKTAAKSPPVEGTLADMTKDPATPTGTIIVQVKGSKSTFRVTERTRFQFFDGTKSRPAGFLSEHVGKPVAVFVKAGSSPPEAGLVRIIVPPPQPKTPKPAWVRGTVVELPDGQVTLKLPNKTPPPPVIGVVTAVTLDDKTDTGAITVKVGDKTRAFTINAGTSFVKLGAKHKHWKESFLAITTGQRVEVFPRYGHPRLAGSVDILLKGARPKPAIHYKDTYITFQLQAATRYEVARGSKHESAARSNLALREDVSILPHTVHGHVADVVRIHAPRAIKGKLESVSGSALRVKVHHGGGKDKPPSDETRTVSLTSSTRYELVEGTTHKPAAASALKAGRTVEILPAAVPPHAAELVRIHHKKAKTTSTSGTVVSAGGRKLSVKTRDGATKQFTLDGRTKLEAHQGKDQHPATAKDLQPGRKVVVKASGEPPHRAEHVTVHVPKAPKAKKEPKPKAKKEPKPKPEKPKKEPKKK